MTVVYLCVVDGHLVNRYKQTGIQVGAEYGVNAKIPTMNFLRGHFMIENFYLIYIRRSMPAVALRVTPCRQGRLEVGDFSRSSGRPQMQRKKINASSNFEFESSSTNIKTIWFFES